MGKVADVTSALRFDLHRGVLLAGEGPAEAGSPDAPAAGDRALVVAEEALAELVAGAGPVVAAAAARQLGASLGRRLAARFGGEEQLRAASLNDVAGALAAEASVIGIGRVAIERWGHALVLAVEHAPRVDRAFLASLFEGALDAVAARAEGGGPHVATLVLEAPEGKDELRVLVSSARAVARVRALLGDGLAWRHALAQLQERRGR